MLNRRKQEEPTEKPVSEKVIKKPIVDDETMDLEDFDFGDYEFEEMPEEPLTEPLTEQEIQEEEEIESGTLTIKLHNNYAFKSNDHEIKIYPYRILEPTDISFLKVALEYYLDQHSANTEKLEIMLVSGKTLQIKSTRFLFDEDIKHIIQSIKYYTS